MGGAGSAVLEYIALQSLNLQTTIMGIPDAYIDHASQSEQWAEMGIDCAGIKQKILSLVV
jgi:1-deoxy-D-xylulose-5-phosphate synthase